MEWEEHLREMAQTADEHPEYKMRAWFTARDAVAEIDRLRAEITRLKAECQKWQKWHDCEYRERKKYRQDANHFAGEVQRLTASLAEKEAECDSIRRANNAWEECTGYPYPACAEVNINKLRQELADARNLAAARLTEKDAECERLVDRIIEQEEAIKRLQEALSEEEFQRKRAESLAASRLADQEAIERHTRRVVAGECAEIASQCNSGYGAAHYIRKKHGVE